MRLGLGLFLSSSRGAIAPPVDIARYDTTLVKADSGLFTMDQDVVDSPALSGTFADGVQGVDYSESIPISGGTGPYTLEIISGAVPDGYTLEVVGSDIVLSGSDPN